MVSLQKIISSNAQLPSTLPPGLVAVFVGGTSGIGAETLKAFAKHTVKPRAYIVGRSQVAADLFIAECHALNSEGSYIFIQADISLLRVVDEVCEQIKNRESEVNLLYLSQGTPNLDRTETPEGLNYLTSLLHTSRTRFITNLFPLLQPFTTPTRLSSSSLSSSYPSIHRVITIAAAGFEGPLDKSDLEAFHISPTQIRGHMASLISLTLISLGQRAPNVSFIHSYPGAVDTPLSRRLLEIAGGNAGMVVGIEEWMSAEESGERHLFLGTSGRYPSRKGPDSAAGDVGAIMGIDGVAGSGVYSVGAHGETVSTEAREFLAGLREQGLVEKVQAHTEGLIGRLIGA
ncbi:uncharacterized protein BDW70DRAFT_168263 [Aspergillus foveolatus]|uniref:uncharacterized protein n=1 Tax=Aspergillus foveolatus TaxID=210207 RepID=UPI003CCCC6C4